MDLEVKDGQELGHLPDDEPDFGPARMVCSALMRLKTYGWHASVFTISSLEFEVKLSMDICFVTRMTVDGRSRAPAGHRKAFGLHCHSSHHTDRSSMN